MASNKESSPIADFWRAYLRSLPPGNPHPSAEQPEAWGFGSSPEMADELGALVVQGVKTATCSLLWEYEHEKEPLPKAGALSIILDGQGLPLCLIETTEVKITAYNKVDAQFAYDEGEGDRSLTYWRAVHWHFFSITCAQIGRSPDESMPLVCERFRIIYRPSR